MPRFYDPSQSDPTVKVLSWFGDLLQSKVNSLSMEQIEEYVQRFNREGLVNTNIQVRNDCSKGHDQFINEYFPAYFDGQRIVVCQNLVKNSAQLLENIIREQEFGKLAGENDKDRMCSQIRACKKSYDIYKTESIRHQTSNCARILFRHRGINGQQLPYDQWIKYTEKLLHESKCYDL